MSSAATTSTTASASPSVAGLSWNELIEHIRDREEVGQRRRRLEPPRVLAEPVDPDTPQPELGAGCDIVEEGGGDVHVTLAWRPSAREELVPVPMARLVR